MVKTKTLLINSSVFFWTVIIISCTSQLEDETRKIESNVTFLIDDVSVNRYLSQREVAFEYFNTNDVVTEIHFSSDSIFSVLIVPTQDKYLEMNCKSNGLQEVSLLFQSGDSVKIELENQRLKLYVMNRKTLPYDDNFETRRNSELFQSNYTPIADFEFLWESANSAIEGINMKNELKQKKELAEQSLKLEVIWLDSLKEAGQLSEDNASFFLKKNRFQLLKLKYFNTEGGIISASEALKFLLSAKEEGHVESFNLYHDRFLDFLLAQLNSNEYTNLPKMLLQYKSGVVRNRVWIKYIKNQLPKLSFQEIDLLFREYGGDLDPELIAYLKRDVSKLLQTEMDIKLKSIEEKFTSLEEILEQNKGSFVYVDLWAAWCVPCIKSFPYSQRLQKDYMEMGVVVIYLSIDENHKYWEQLVQKYDIAIPNRSFIVMNSEESKYLKELKVEFIPRYLLFDSNSELIHQNAPRPESSEIRTLLDSIISE